MRIDAGSLRHPSRSACARRFLPTPPAPSAITASANAKAEAGGQRL